MKISKISESQNVLRFQLDEASPAMANSIRRGAMFETPALAIEDIYFVKNNSALYDEQIASRLGLLPLKADLSKLSFPDECACKGKGCGNCQVKAKLKIDGPCTVYAKDLEIDSAQPLFPETPIAILLKGQSIELSAIAVLGRGKDHAKWQPCLAFYQHVPKIKVGNGAGVKKGIDSCPKQVFDKSGKVVDKFACTLCKACEAYSEGAITVEAEENNFIFTIESWGQIEPRDILKQAASAVKSQLKDLEI